MINQSFRWPTLVALVLLLAGCNDASSSDVSSTVGEASPAPVVAAELLPSVEAAVPETAPVEVTAVPPTLEADPAYPPPLPAESSALPELHLSQRWRHDTSSPVSMIDFVSMDGLPFPDIAAVTEDGHVVALSINDIAYWEALLNQSPLALAAGQVYGGANGDVAVSTEANGIQLLELDFDKQAKILWQYGAPSKVTTLTFMNAVAGATGTGLLAGTDDGLLLALDAADEPQSTIPVKVDDTAVMFIETISGSAGSRSIVVLTEAGKLSLLGEQGTILWQQDILAPASQLLTADLNDNGQPEIIVGTTSGEAIAFDQAGTELWRWQSDHPVEALAPARLEDEMRILAASDGRLAALSSSETVPWQYQFSDSVIKAVDSGDVDGDGQAEIVIGSEDGVIWILDENGPIRGTYNVGIPVNDLKLVNMDKDRPQPELVVWGGSTIFLFNATSEGNAATEPGIDTGEESPLDEVALGDLPHYGLDVMLDVAAHRAQVQQETTVRNTSEEPWDELVFHVAPVYWPGLFNLNDVTVQMNGETSEVIGRFDLTMLHIPLPRPIEPGEEVKVGFNFELDLPQLNPIGWGPTGNAGWGSGIIQMGDWYPALVPYQPGSGWRTWDFKPVGDPVISRLADYDVVIRPSTNVEIAAPGFQQELENGDRRFRLEGARAFSFLASPDYILQRGDANGVPVTVYTTERYRTAGGMVLNTAIAAINLFTELYGPYPYNELIIAENGFLTAMEYSGLVSLSGFAFDAYDGTASSLLVAITAHEVAHQWWYGAVGNDQVLEPWLDEGMAMMSELLFYESYYPNLTDWWWQYRVDRWNPTGWVDDTIYDYNDSESFVHNMYGPAARFMFELRDLMGADAFYQFIKDYSIRNRDSFVTRDDFFDAVQSHTNAEITSLIGDYFKSDGS